MNRSFLLLAAGASALLMASSALGADLIIDEPVIMPAASTFDWSGFYAGAHVGWGTGSVLVDPLDAPDESTAEGWLLGVQAGANTQMDSFVLGIEGDVAWSNISNSDEVTCGAFCGVVDVNWLASLRGRAGVAFDSVLLYATAGVAGAGIDYTDLDFDPGVTASGTHFGWTAGVGAEVAVSDNMSLKAEYLYYDFAAQTYDLGTPDDVSFNLHTVKVGLNVHF